MKRIKEPVTADLKEHSPGYWGLGLWNGIGYVTIASTDEFTDFDRLKRLGERLLEKKFIKKLCVQDYKTIKAEELESDLKLMDHYGPRLEMLEARMASGEPVPHDYLNQTRTIFLGCSARLEKAA